MATPEVAVLQGVFSQWYAVGEGRATTEVHGMPWVKNIGRAFLDIEHGLGTINNRCDKNFWRVKMAGILMAKALKADSQLLCSSNFEPLFTSAAIPTLNWTEYFDCICFLGLGPELTEILLEVDPAVLKLIFNDMQNWINGKSSLSRNILKVTLLISLAISAVLHQFFGEDIKRVLDPVNGLLEFTRESKLWESVEYEWKPNTVEAKCQASMVIRLQALLSDAKQHLEDELVGLPNVFYCSKIPHLLSTATLQSIQESRCEDNCRDLLNNMMALKDACSEILKTISSDSETYPCNDYIKLTLTRVKSLLGRSECSDVIFQKLLSLVVDVENFGKADQPRQILSEEIGLKGKRFFIIAHRLNGFEKAVHSLLSEMVEDPVQKDSWKEAFVCLQNSIECIATKNSVLSILNGVHNSIFLAEKNGNNIHKYIASATSFQMLFWNAFRLLRVVDKVSITESIISQRNLTSLLGKYPLKGHELDSQKVEMFTLSQKKKIKLVFDGTMKEVSVKDSTIEKFCEAILLSPEVSIRKVVEYALRSEEQVRLMRGLILEIQSILDFIKPGSKRSLFWESYCDIMILHWDRNEVSSVENGMNFICELLENDHLSKIETDGGLLIEVFHTLAVSLGEDKVNTTECLDKTEISLPLKLGVKTLSRVVVLSVFFNAIPIEQIVALCFAIAGCIERSTPFFNSDQKFDEEVHEMQLDNLEFLVSKSAEKLSSGMDKDMTLLRWIQHVIPTFNWTLQLLFLPLVKKIDGFQQPVPKCLSEVCTIPTVLKPCEELSYGTGTGLLAWYQCFVTDPSLCPLSSLDVHNLTLEGIRLFSNGWIVTLSQVLPYCLPSQWYRLVEASKILMSDYKLYVPFSTKSVMSLPLVEIREIHSLLGIVQLLSQVFELLSKTCCAHWTSMQMWSHVSKCYCFVSSCLISSSAEFHRAGRDGQIFFLSQMFCSVCYLTSLLEHLPDKKQSKQGLENFFILSLDVIMSFEKIFIGVQNPENDSDDDKSDASGSTGSIGSTNSILYEETYQKTMLGIHDRLQEMLLAVSLLQNEENQRTLNQKLLTLLEVAKE